MAAISPFTVHAATPGVRMNDIGLTGDEDFLLVHSVDDTAEYGSELKRFNIAGEKIYHVLQDPSLTFAFDCSCLAFEGLANAHPGQAVTPADINNIIPGAFGWDTGTGISYIFRRPRRRRTAGNLASLNFEIHVELGNQTIPSTSLDDLSAATWGDPADIMSESSESYAPTPSVFSSTIFWRRRAVLDYTGIPALNDPSNAFGIETYEYCQEWPAASAQPANLAAFRVSVDSVADTSENQIVEVYHVPTGTHWIHDPEGNRIPQKLVSTIDPIDVQTFPDVAARFIAVWVNEGEDEYYPTSYFGAQANLTAFLTTYNSGVVDNGVKALISLYDMRAASWLYGP